MESSGSSSLALFVLKAIVSALVIFAGVAGGIYTGLALRGTARVNPEGLLNSTYLSIGERFPDYELWDTDAGENKNISDVVRDAPAVLLFLSQQCGACRTMLTHWQKRVIPTLRQDIRIILIYDDVKPPSDESLVYPDIVRRAIVATTNRTEQRDDDGIVGTPTLVALDNHMTIRFIVSGFDRQIDSEFMGRHL